MMWVQIVHCGGLGHACENGTPIIHEERWNLYLAFVIIIPLVLDAIAITRLGIDWFTHRNHMDDFVGTFDLKRQDWYV